VGGQLSVATNKLVVDATTGAVTGPNTGAFVLDNGNASSIDIGGTTATTLNLGRTGQTQALLGNATVAGTLNVAGQFSVATNKLVVNAGTGAVTGPNTGAFSLDNGNASAINIGGTTATTLNLGRSGQTQALLGNGTVAGTLTVTGQTNANGNLRIGTAGTAIIAHFSATATLDIAAMDASCVDTTMTVTGASVGDTVVATPTPTAGGIETRDDVTYYAFVSAADTVTIRSCEATGAGAGQNPSSQTWRADVWHH
jgi:hypothetical protein